MRPDARSGQLWPGGAAAYAVDPWGNWWHGGGMKHMFPPSLIRLSVPLMSAGALALSGCQRPAPIPVPSVPETVADTPTDARAPDGQYISWVEHIIDAEDVNGGVPIRGGDGIAMADLDGDGFEDIVTAQEDSNHLRIAFGTGDPDVWVLRTIAEGGIVGAIEDVSVGDLNGDGWPDIAAACEEAHLAYFQNPGADAKTADWPSLVPPVTQGRGSWLRVFVTDIDGDGRPDLTAANKGGSDIVQVGEGETVNRATSLFTLSGPPLEADSWQEQVLFEEGIPNTALPLDIDGDGDLDVLAAKRVKRQLVVVRNLGTSDAGTLEYDTLPVRIAPAFDAPDDWTGTADAFQADVADLNGDGRVDLVLVVVETSKADPMLPSGFGWLEQPEDLSAPWRYHRIGHILPDWVTGIHLADIDGDGDLDAITGGYSGLNILAGSYSGASRDFDEPTVTAADSVGRIAWFENPGDPAAEWARHDISRRVRGMYDMFVSRDMDGDGDLDIIAPRGNSGSYDGVFWLEQVRSDEQRAAFTAARESESRHLPLPPDNWLELYGRGETYVAPNKVK